MIIHLMNTNDADALMMAFEVFSCVHRKASEMNDSTQFNSIQFDLMCCVVCVLVQRSEFNPHA
jgi:hypothetical protein